MANFIELGHLLVFHITKPHPLSKLHLTSESKKYFFEIKMVSRDDVSAKSAETRIL